jgi:hypothetical protein
MKRILIGLLGSVACLLVIVCSASLGLEVVRRLAGRIGEADARHYGTIGDMFGAVSALFAGLGFLGLIVALGFDIRERKRDLDDRKEARRPYILATIPPDGVIFDKAYRSKSNSRLEVEFSAHVKLMNATDEPALNIALKTSHDLVEIDLAVETTVVDVPVAPRGDRESVITFSCRGQDATALIRRFNGGSGIEILITATYASLTKLQWVSKCAYRLAPGEGNEPTFAKILDPASGFSIGGPDGDELGQDPLYLVATPMAGTWEQTPQRPGSP